MRLRDNILVIPKKEFIYVGYADGLKIPNNELYLKLLYDLKSGIEQSEFDLKYNFVSCKELKHRLDVLDFVVYEDYSIFTNSMIEKNLFYYERFKGSSLVKNDKLGNFKVCIIGLGGIGGNVLQMLLSAGIKSFVLIDFDEVDISNLNRQYLYRIDDIGLNKVKVCEKFIKKHDVESDISTHFTQIESVDDLMRIVNAVHVDMIIQCADTPNNINKITLEVCKELNIPMAYGGVGIDSGFFEIIDLRKIEMYGLESMKENRYVPKGSIGVTNSIIASYLAYDIVHFVLNEAYYSKESKVIIKFP